MLWVPRIGQKIPHPRITLPCFIFLGDRKKSNPNTSKTPQTKQRFINIHEPPDPAYINNNKNIKNHITKTKPVSHELLSLFVLLPVATPGPPFVKDGLMVTPLKFNMEPENQPLEKEIPFGNHHFQVPC